MPFGNILRQRLGRLALGLCILTVLALVWPSTHAGPRLDQFLLDYCYTYFNHEQRASKQVVVIDIDEGSMKLLGPHYGRWPWPRRIYKDIIEFLTIGEPAGIFFDLLFTEATVGTKDDAMLAEISAQTKYTSHAMLLHRDSATDNEGITALPINFGNKFGLKWQGIPMAHRPLYRDFSLPAPEFLAKTPSIHLVTVDKDDDGIFRKMPLALPYGDFWFPSLALRAVMMTLKEPVLTVQQVHAQQFMIVQGTNSEKASINYTIPIGHDGMYRLHYYRSDRRPETISFASVLSAAASLQKGDVQDPAQLKVNPLDFKDKLILIGGSAAGLEDLKVTPVDPSYPGILLHATAISNILDGTYLRIPPFWLPLSITLLTIMLVYGFMFLSSRVFVKFGVPAFWLVGFGVTGIYFFHTHSLWLGLARPLTLGTLALFDSLTYLIFVEMRDKRKLKDSLSKYLNPTMAEQIVSTGQDPRAEVGNQKELSILFSDIRGFTSLSEKLEPKFLVTILNDYLGRMTDVIFDHKGTLDKFIGDAIMAFWGSPLRDLEHATNSVRCALQMRSVLKVINQQATVKGLIPLETGVGINSGNVIVGNIGSEKRLDYTVIGDNVNMASRLESLTKQYGLGILAGQRTEELTRDSIIYRPIDFVRVKGKMQHVEIYEPLGLVGCPEANQLYEFAGKFREALSLYRCGSFDQASKKFEAMVDPTSQIFAKRCHELIAESPKDWDGIFVAKSK